MRLLSPREERTQGALAPATIDAEVDDLIDCVAEGRAKDFGTLMRRIEGQGIAPVTLCIAASRHFRALHAGASDPGGPGAGFARLRPPVFGPRRDRMIRQAQDWGMRALEDAAESLGGSAPQRFAYIVVPALRHSMLSGLIVVLVMVVNMVSDLFGSIRSLFSL